MENSTFWNTTVPRVLSTYAVVIFAILWVGLATALVLDQVWLDLLWDWVQALPALVKISSWVFITPIMAAVWIWESSWTVLIRLLAFAGLVGWTSLAVSSFLQAFGFASKK